MKIFAILALLVAPTFLSAEDDFDNQPPVIIDYNKKDYIDLAFTESDKKINAEIKLKLNQALFSGNLEITRLQTRDGNIIISGIVDTIDDSRVVRDEIKSIKGVKSLTASIKVREKLD